MRAEPRRRKSPDSARNSSGFGAVERRARLEDARRATGNGIAPAMRAMIDRYGRVVIPKPIRLAAGLTPGTEVEVRLVEGLIQLAPVRLAIRFEDREGVVVAVAEDDVPPLTNEQVESTRQALLRRSIVSRTRC
jgi:AbrB family looped-hinge helix DNA binding protein